MNCCFTRAGTGNKPLKDLAPVPKKPQLESFSGCTPRAARNSAGLFALGRSVRVIFEITPCPSLAQGSQSKPEKRGLAGNFRRTPQTCGRAEAKSQAPAFFAAGSLLGRLPVPRAGLRASPIAGLGASAARANFPAHLRISALRRVAPLHRRVKLAGGVHFHCLQGSSVRAPIS